MIITASLSAGNTSAAAVAILVFVFLALSIFFAFFSFRYSRKYARTSLPDLGNLIPTDNEEEIESVFDLDADDNSLPEPSVSPPKLSLTDRSDGSLPPLPKN
jgi:hypothetical protein